MMTDRDVTAVLQGSGGTVLIDVLNRGFNLGPVAMNELSQADKNKITNGEYSEEISRALVGAVQESLNVGDILSISTTVINSLPVMFNFFLSKPSLN